MQALCYNTLLYAYDFIEYRGGSKIMPMGCSADTHLLVLGRTEQLSQGFIGALKGIVEKQGRPLKGMGGCEAAGHSSGTCLDTKKS